MDEQTFIAMYNTAIQKVAVGFYILDNCGDRLGFDPDTILVNKQMLCGMLAEGINVSITSVYMDACSVQLQPDYIRHLQASGLLEDLISEMSCLTTDKRCKLNYN
jgi:hypothetical protein